MSPARQPWPTPPGVPRFRHLANILRRRIDSGRKGYLPGDRFPTEPQLIEESGYSRETVRAAIRVLRQEGLLDVTLGVGTFVAAREVWGRGAR